MAVAVTAETRQARAIADVVADHDPIEMAMVDQCADQPEPCRVVGHVDVGEAVVARLLAEQVELDGDARLGQPQQARLVEDGAVDMADHDALGRMAGCFDEIRHLLQLVGIAAGMDVDGRARLGPAISAACITRFSVSVHGAEQPISPIMPARTSVPQAPCRIWPIISWAKSSTARPWFLGSW